MLPINSPSLQTCLDTVPGFFAKYLTNQAAAHLSQTDKKIHEVIAYHHALYLNPHNTLQQLKPLSVSNESTPIFYVVGDNGVLSTQADQNLTEVIHPRPILDIDSSYNEITQAFGDLKNFVVADESVEPMEIDTLGPKISLQEDDLIDLLDLYESHSDLPLDKDAEMFQIGYLEDVSNETRQRVVDLAFEKGYLQPALEISLHFNDMEKAVELSRVINKPEAEKEFKRLLALHLYFCREALEKDLTEDNYTSAKDYLIRTALIIKNFTHGNQLVLALNEIFEASSNSLPSDLSVEFDCALIECLNETAIYIRNHPALKAESLYPTLEQNCVSLYQKYGAFQDAESFRSL